ncbi:site-specific integrase [Demequina sp. SYSU T00192]|uniref:Site-specific integrase n=1 Tax=Demequina litoralis TaxID=3051660 RepID=A0ABT8G677_9MICO|nr:site-specific integrase [Demequina sp. SYSU T00192]MDN4474632.1 site-specific integrase [Demequina sp. SYSU T00192]
MASIVKQANGRWRARYRDNSGTEHSQRFDRKSDAQRWIDAQSAALVRGDYVDPATARTTVAAWCDTWLDAYSGNQPSTVRQARVHVKHIVEEFGAVRLVDVKPSAIRAWCARLKRRGLADSTVYAIHARLSQILADAVHDGIIARNPCSRRTSPGAGKQRPYVVSTAQVWALHDAVPGYVRPAVLLGAFAGLRVAEVCGLRVEDVDFMRGLVSPRMQYPDRPLKTDASAAPVPIPIELAAVLGDWTGERGWIVEDLLGRQVGPWAIQRAVRDAREAAALPEEFRFHDLRHYFASLLIAAGADVKVVQARLRHSNATTTLNTYAHLWPDTEESTRAAVAEVLAARADSVEPRAAGLRPI